MFKNARIMRIVLNGILLLAIVALGVTVYQAGTSEKQEQEQAQVEEEAQEEGMQETEEEVPMVDAGTNEVQAEMTEETAQPETEETPAEEEMTQETAQNEAAAEMVEMETEDAAAASAEIEVNFTESSLMEWPLSGELVLDYNMDNTVYFPTLDQYKLSPAIAVKSDVGAPVTAAANGTVTSIYEDAETGLTMTMDLGNGYEAVYGQLQEPAAVEGQTVAQGAILGYVSEPTKYYSVEGSNLYFAMKKDGQPIDPITYLP